jgi:hypothetical protein
MATRDRSAASPPPARSASAPAEVSASDRPLPDESDLPRLPDQFQRLYSPPEAPRALRRTFGAGAVAAALGVVGLAGVAVLTFGHGTPHQPSESRVPRPSAAASHAPVVPKVFAAIPGACDVLSAGTVRRFVPAARPHVDRMGVDTAGVCKYSSTQGGHYRAVQVDARGFLPRYLHDQAASMTVWSYEAQWKQAQKDLTADTSSLRRIGGLGDAAFERYWVDRDAHVAVGEATVRYRNVVLRTQYTEDQPAAADRAASERRCLEAAIAAARTGLTSFH